MFIGREAELSFFQDKNAKNGLRVAGTEIDLLGIGRDAKKYLVGERKFKASPFNYSEYLDTKAKYKIPFVWSIL